VAVRGLVIADTSGSPLYFSSEGRRLLYLATNSPRAVPEVRMTLPPPVAMLCRSLARIYADDSTAPSPIYHSRNVWGGFTFRASWLKGEETNEALVAIAITHQEPLPVQLVRRVGELPLSRRQSEVCVLLASGASNDAIAERLGISRHTANEHGRWIYHRLDVHSRAELLSRLLAPDTTATRH